MFVTSLHKLDQRPSAFFTSQIPLFTLPFRPFILNNPHKTGYKSISFKMECVSLSKDKMMKISAALVLIFVAGILAAELPFVKRDYS